MDDREDGEELALGILITITMAVEQLIVLSGRPSSNCLIVNAFRMVIRTDVRTVDRTDVRADDHAEGIDNKTIGAGPAR